MQQHDRRSIAIFNEAIALLLAGTFAIGIAISIEDSPSLFQVSNTQLFGIGIFLILAGVIVVLNIFQIPFITRTWNKLPRRARSLFLLIVPLVLFIVATTQYIIEIIKFASIPVIYYIGFAILLFILAALIYTVFRDRQRIQNIPALLFAFSLNLLSMYLVFSRFQDIRLILMLLGSSSIIILLIAIRIYRSRERQLPLFRRQDFRMRK